MRRLAVSVCLVTLILLFTDLCFLGTAGASVPPPSIPGQDYATTNFWWHSNWTSYMVGSSITARGQAWVDACRKSACKGSNTLGNDYPIYGSPPLDSNFFYWWYAYNGQQYNNTLGFAAWVDTLACIQRELQSPPCYQGSDWFYIRFNDDDIFSTACPCNPAKYCFHCVCCHELGHAAGLADLFNVQPYWGGDRPTMYRLFGLNDYEARTISFHDENGMLDMYE